VPLVAFSANVLPQDREACAEAGMDDFLPKPARRADLLAAARRWLASTVDAEGAALAAPSGEREALALRRAASARAAAAS
jgi:CheY-like chemotaxis protein